MSTDGDLSTIPRPDRDHDPARSRPARRRNYIRQFAARCWDCILRFALVLWIARVPLATTALGLLFLGLVPQAQDVFVEFAGAPTWWMFFFLFVLFAGWAMPTHYAARMLLDTDTRFQEFLAGETALNRAACLERSSKWVPRALGLLTFVAVLIAICRSYLNLPDLDQKEVIAAVDRSLMEMTVLVVVGAAVFLLYVIRRSRSADLPVLRSIKRINRRLAPLWRMISPGLMDVRGSDDEASRDVGRFILLAIFVIFLGIFGFGADTAGQLFPRAMAVPFILGGWVPFLSNVSGFGRQFRAPLILILFLAISGLVVLIGDNHTVRRVVAAGTVGHAVDVSPIRLDAAVATWMHENGCDGAPATCPRPIIIAAAGGASRAAFFMSTIIGYFMQEAATHGLDPNQVRNRLFAISSVSGGAAGAVMVTAALAAKNDSNDHPCIQKPVDLWWGDTVNNWRDCFEALTSGDFLTSGFFGFAFNDMLPFGFFRDRAAVLEDTWDNRFQAVVTRADQPASLPSCKGLNCPFLTLRPRPGHWIPLLVLNGTSEATGSRIITTALAMTYSPKGECPTADVASDCPLFVQADRFHDLLTTKVGSDAWFGWVGGFERYLLRDAGGDDIRLSTAALNSARFPLISPPGAVRNQDQAIVDRIVDGGYFENYGALGAKELALAVHAAQPQLAPFVIVISNDPNDLLDSSDDSPNAKTQPPAQLGDRVEKARAKVNTTEWLTDISAPVTTIANARSAHGILGVDQLHSTLRDAIPGCDELLIKVRVWPQYGKELSMSWWESAPIQRQLHRQTEGTNDQNQNGTHLDAIWALMKTTSSCAATKP
ncbi:hypothetical protein [Bradyrhizobium erythrophlei]|uniref:Patatin-like phospholipase n=1 Tax=Bradyrhizobium erythrophlei TaxID=1437360 RepID=A0A1M5GJ85_9BRAD|nr:hypothetical protein [Bradyrhizobium erythrophlei]SHG03810.1 hypothetical protein SAMN05443248_0061 [Bradyrhizobium erythrophlei]